MKNTKVKLLSCIGLLAWMAMAPAQAAAPITQKESSQSIELGNLDEPDTASDLPAPATGSNSQTDAAVARAPQAKATSQDTPTGETDSPTAKAAAQTPMERYRDLKLQQASSASTTNPATARRYLKVDRASYMDSVGGVQ